MNPDTLFAEIKTQAANAPPPPPGWTIRADAVAVPVPHEYRFANGEPVTTTYVMPRTTIELVEPGASERLYMRLKAILNGLGPLPERIIDR